MIDEATIRILDSPAVVAAQQLADLYREAHADLAPGRGDGLTLDFGEVDGLDVVVEVRVNRPEKDRHGDRKPADYEWNGQTVSHYLNHAGEWHGMPAYGEQPPLCETGGMS